MNEIIICGVIIIGGSILFGYGAIYKPMKDTLKRYREVDDEEIPEGIAIIED